jgi:hypothetical protein
MTRPGRMPVAEGGAPLITTKCQRTGSHITPLVLSQDSWAAIRHPGFLKSLYHRGRPADLETAPPDLSCHLPAAIRLPC